MTEKKPLKPFPTDKERRQYFRIKNWLLLQFEPVDSIDDIPDFDAMHVNASPKIALLQELAALEAENQSYLASLTEKQSLLGNYLKGINHKVELLTRFMIQTLDHDKNELQEVDISGGGVRFKSPQMVDIDAHLKLELILVPECYGIVCYARVVDFKPNIDGGLNEIACIFTRLREHDRDAIIKHVFQAQSRQLRAANQKPSETQDASSE